MVLTEGDFVPEGAFGNVSGHFLIVTAWEGATGISWVETRDDAKYPTMHRTTIYNKNLSHSKCQ